MIVEGKARISATAARSPCCGPAVLRRALVARPAPRNATVIADTDMELLVLGQREFAKIVDAAPAFARALLAGIARRINEADTKRPN